MYTLNDAYIRHKEEYRIKGCVLNLSVSFKSREVSLSFYDEARFIQTLKDDLRAYRFFYESNTVILREVSESEILAFLEKNHSLLFGDDLSGT